MQEGLKDKVRKRFKDIEFKKIVLYKNPNEFNKIYIERVNPNHVGILWGIRKRSLKKGSGQIKWGKVYFASLPVIIGLTTTGYIEVLTGYAFNLLVTIGFTSLFIASLTSIILYYIPLKLGSVNKCPTS